MAAHDPRFHQKSRYGCNDPKDMPGIMQAEEKINSNLTAYMSEALKDIKNRRYAGHCEVELRSTSYSTFSICVSSFPRSMGYRSRLKTSIWQLATLITYQRVIHIGLNL